MAAKLTEAVSIFKSADLSPVFLFDMYLLKNPLNPTNFSADIETERICIMVSNIENDFRWIDFPFSPPAFSLRLIFAKCRVRRQGKSKIHTHAEHPELHQG